MEAEIVEKAKAEAEFTRMIRKTTKSLADRKIVAPIELAMAKQIIPKRKPNCC